MFTERYELGLLNKAVCPSYLKGYLVMQELTEGALCNVGLTHFSLWERVTNLFVKNITNADYSV